MKLLIDIPSDVIDAIYNAESLSDSQIAHMQIALSEATVMDEKQEDT